MSDNKTKVYCNKTHSGNLSYEDGAYIFNYLENTQDLVSLTMPLRNASWQSKVLHPIFQMNLPEGALKDAIQNHFSKIELMDELKLLKLIGPYMLGRVKFEKLIDEKESLNIEEILCSKKQSLFDELMERFAIKSGISGVQPKLLLQAHNKTTMKFEHYIIKSWEDEYPNLALNEYFCMKAIQKAKLITPEFYLSDDLKMFIMKRFDICDDNSYLGFEDMCVLTARTTQEKYNGSYEEIVRVLKDILPAPKRKESLKSIFTALVMNHFLKNGDAHLKNYGVLYKNDFQDSFLAPIYDVITTTLYIKNDIPALRLSDGKLWWKEKTYKTFAKQSCGLTLQEYESILTLCKNAIRETKKEIDEYITQRGDTKEFLEQLKACWSEEL